VLVELNVVEVVVKVVEEREEVVDEAAPSI
jgi:hypothetical protein